MAAKFCSQCGHEVSSTARFCPNCAAPLNGPVSPMGTATTVTTPLDLAARKSRSLLLPAAIAAAVVLAVAVAVLAGQSHRQASVLASAPPPQIVAPAITNAPANPPSASPPLTGAPNTPPAASPPLTGAPNTPPAVGPAITNAPNTPPPTLPPDVAAYLQFLAGIEQRRVAMNNDVSGAAAMMTIAQGMSSAQSDPENGEEKAKESTKQLSQGYSDYALKWQSLIREFRATPAPPSCTLLANNYLLFLSDYTTVITKMQVALLNHDASGLPDLSAVSQVQAQVDADGTKADGALTDLCARYGVPKPFVIAPEGAAPSLLGH